MSEDFRDLFNFNGINWWTLLGGLGLNFVITAIIAIAGAYLGTNEATAEFYGRYGPPIMVIVVFVACVGAGFITAKIADDVPTKHAFISSLGAVVPFVLVAVLSFNPMLFMMAAIAAAGNLNGGMLAAPRRRHGPPPR
jgi:FtsH-binding integral membrane protein